VRASDDVRALVRDLAHAAESEGEGQDLERELEAWVAALRGLPLLLTACNNPAVPVAGRVELLSRVGAALATQQGLRRSPALAKVLGALARDSRLGLLQRVAPGLREVLDRQRSRVRVQIHSARPLPQEDEGQLLQGLSRRFEGQLLVERKVEPRLIGGLVATVGDLSFDGSVKGRLAALRRSLEASLVAAAEAEPGAGQE